MLELADRMTAEIARVRGKRGNPAAAQRRLGAIGTAYLRFAHEEPGLFAAAYALPAQHAYGASDAPDRTPLGLLRAALDELVEAGVLSPERREGIEYPIWATVHGTATLTTHGPLRDLTESQLRQVEARTLAFIGNSLTQ